MRRFILGLDEGTTNLKSVLFDVDKMEIVDKETRNFKQYYPQSGWVEQDAEEIYKNALKASKDILKRNSVCKDELLGMAITNQRETVVAWDRQTGKPICKAIVWQCRRTSKMMDGLSDKIKREIKEKTGLIPNPYFSASKMKWIMENVKEAKLLAKQNRLCFGTVDSFLTFKLTGNHVTDTTNASRTMLMDLKTLQYDKKLLSLFKIPVESLPEIKDTNSFFGNAKPLLNVPIRAIAGDQMASMYGQGILKCGEAKITFGTGGFILINIGNNCSKATPNLVTTVASTLNGKTEYALEGSIYSAGSAMNWLKNLDMYDTVEQTEKMALSLKDNEGVYMLPAFTGLGAPYWNNEAKAKIVGLTLSSKKEHIVRATLESMAYNTKAIVDELKQNGYKVKTISVDGGISNNKFVLQFLADMLGQPVVKSKSSEATVLGAIYIALNSLNLLSVSDMKNHAQANEIYQPKISVKERKKYYDGWLNAIKKI